MDPEMRKKLDAWFTYHPPKGDQAARYGILRDAAMRFAETVVENTPPGPDQTVALRKVREAVMTANAAIACGE